MSIRVLLVDDHPIVRQGLLRLLEIEPDFHVAGEAGDGLEAIELAKVLQPDVLILDLMMPGLNGLEVARQVLAWQPDLRVVVLSMHQDEAYVMQALRCGAKGYVLKDSSPLELASAIREVAKGGSYLSKAINQKLVNAMFARLGEDHQLDHASAVEGEPGMPHGPEPKKRALTPRMVQPERGTLPERSQHTKTTEVHDAYELLSNRERVVLQLIAEGNTNSEVARRLEISPRTAEAHRASIMHKLNLSNITELMRFAIKHGIIKLDS